MATIMSSCTTIVPATVKLTNYNAKQRRRKVVYIKGLNSYGGLMDHNMMSAVGKPISSAHYFAKVVCSLRLQSVRRPGGSAMAATCNAASEIFTIAAVMNVLVLVGVAVGFVLLRIEAALEESESK